MAHGVRIPPAEFPVVVDRASYVIPTIGISAIAAIAASIVAIGVGIAIGARVPSESREQVEVEILFSWIIAAGVLSGAWWVRRRWRIHHERKLVVDRDGITYVPFAGRSEMMRWHEIIAVEEKEEWGPDEGMSLIYRMQHRTFTVRDSDYQGYPEIRHLTKAYLPGRTVVRPHG